MNWLLLHIIAIKQYDNKLCVCPHRFLNLTYHIVSNMYVFHPSKVVDRFAIFGKFIAISSFVIRCNSELCPCFCCDALLADILEVMSKHTWTRVLVHTSSSLHSGVFSAIAIGKELVIIQSSIHLSVIL